MHDQKKKNNESNKKMSFIDETNNITKKVQVKKRNKELNIKQTRLRKPLQNEKLLKNYFEFEKKQLTTSDVTVYKMINTPINNTYTSNNNNNNNIENITTNSSSDSILDASTSSSSNSQSIETPTIVGVDKIVTSKKVKYENLNQIFNNQNSSTNQQHSIINSTNQQPINSTITHSSNRSEGSSSSNNNSESTGSSSSNENSKEEEEVEEEEFNDCESFLSSISFLYH